MKRLHVHIAAIDLEKSIDFYSSMFDCRPHLKKDDHAKWMLEDPRLNFAISARGRKSGLDHLGIQVDSPEELVALTR
jgi:catechol 2,3-dioxygenase-like lactoylglutathione lyase family enzyme